MFKVINLKTEYTEHLLGTDKSKPRFFWQLKSEKRGCKQSAYQVRVERLNEKGDPAELVWDSGKTEAANGIGIPYQGKALQAETEYTFTVKVWNEDGEQAEAASVFETGLMNTDCMDGKPSAAWAGAKWIGGSAEDLTWFPHYLSVFKASYELQIAPGSTRAGFVFGANDSRLQARNMNLYEMESGKDESYIYVETDLTGLFDGGKAMLHIYRVGYHPGDRAEVPFKSLEIDAITPENCYAPHTYHLWAEYGIFDFFVDGTEDGNKLNKIDPNDPRPPMFRSAGINLNPVGVGNNFISYPMVCDLGVKVPAGQKAALGHITVCNFRKPCSVLYREKEAPKTVDGGENGYFCVKDTSGAGVPMLRTEFEAEKEVQKARLYITARGVYEAYLNGERVGDDWFNPGLTQYNKTHMYQTYDVTAQVKRGSNAFGVKLGEGWWSGSITFTGSNWNFFGDRNSLLAKMVITYADGSTKTVVTEPENWKVTTDGPIRFSGFFQGEVTDTRLEEKVNGWAEADFDFSGWKPAAEIVLGPDNAYVGTFASTTPFGPQVEKFEYDSCALIGQVGPNVKVSEILTAKSVTEPRPGVYLYDMGQNMAGVERIHIKNGKPGQCVTLRFGEITYPDLKEYEGHEGMLMLENIRAALAQDKFILKGGDQVLQPTFTFHGYQYIEITGIDEPLPPEAVEGIALSSVPEMSASYKTSNEEVNKLWNNITWSLRDNYISIPTDCPQRNERMGWSGDLSVFSRSAVYMADSAGFLERHMMAMRDTQADNGRFADIAPLGGGFGGVLWGSAGITAPWEAYLQYRDLDMLKAQYPAMKKYIDFLDTRIDPDTGILNEGPLGDWLGPEYSVNQPEFLWSAYHVYDLDIMVRIAEILNIPEDAAYYRKKYEERKAFFNTTFVDPETHQTIFSGEKAMLGNRRPMMMGEAKSPLPKALPSGNYPMDSQTSYAVPLALGVFADEYINDAVQHLVETVERENIDNDGVVRPPYSLMTGFIGTAWISQALSKYGKDKESYRLLQNGEYPSWIYSVRQGATTIWERLNSYTKDNGFGGNNSMNSFNHYSFGAVAAWMSMYSLGIMREMASPGFTHFTLCPTPDPDGVMTWAEGHVETVSGRIESRWEKCAEGMCYTVTVPAGTTASLKLIAEENAQITESGMPVDAAAGVTDTGYADGRRCFELVSGTYAFSVK